MACKMEPKTGSAMHAGKTHHGISLARLKPDRMQTGLSVAALTLKQDRPALNSATLQAMSGKLHFATVLATGLLIARMEKYTTCLY